MKTHKKCKKIKKNACAVTTKIKQYTLQILLALAGKD